jgi:hypothetical protein
MFGQPSHGGRMDTTQIHRRSAAAAAVRTISVPALVGATLGALAALVLPNGDQGDVMSAGPSVLT